MPTAKINGIELYCELSGPADADPIVLVHGSWGDHHSWDAVVPALSREWRVLAYDRRGHSLSERPRAQGSIHEDVDDLAALIEHLGLAPAHVAGGSFGGSIALRLAARKPELLRRLLVHEPPLFGLLAGNGDAKALQSQQERIASVLSLLEAGQWENGARQFAETVAFGPGAWPQMSAELRRTFVFNAPTFLDEQRDPEWLSIDLRELAAFTSPVLLTQGDRSEPFFPSVVDKLAQALPQAQRETFVAAGHVPQITHPLEYARCAAAFFGAN